VPVRVRRRAIALVALVAAPLAVGTAYDSFPLSTYPMFAGDRARVASVATVVGVGPDGVERLSSQEIGGTDEPMLAAETVARAVARGQADALCAEVARRVRAGHGADRLEVVTERYDTLAWFDGGHEPLERTVHASCEAAL
jgi:hypothetical protein